MPDETGAKGTETEQLTSPDFDERAADYDGPRWRLQPITDALLERLPEIEDGALVLDVATGTGEPGLTLARRRPGLRVLGIDTAPAMVEEARRKAATEPVPNARFEVMDAEKLDLADDSAAAVISRLGLLIFGEPSVSVAEMARILAPGGPFSIAVWDRTRFNPIMDLSIRTLKAVLSADKVPDFGWVDDLAAGGKREKWLRDAGVRSVHSELFHLTFDEPDLATVWKLVEAGPHKQTIAALDVDERTRAYSYLEGLVSDHRASDGSYQLPVACRLLWGRA